MFSFRDNRVAPYSKNWRGLYVLAALIILLGFPFISSAQVETIQLANIYDEKAESKSQPDYEISSLNQIKTEVLSNKDLGKYLFRISESAINSAPPISVCCFNTDLDTLSSQAKLIFDGRTVGKDLFSGENLVTQLTKRMKENIAEEEEEEEQTVVIVGYADNRANDLYNINLGIARAKKIAAMLCSNTYGRLCLGPNSIRPVIVSCGRMSERLGGLSSEDILQRQRRVDIYFPGKAMLRSNQFCVHES